MHHHEKSVCEHYFLCAWIVFFAVIVWIPVDEGAKVYKIYQAQIVKGLFEREREFEFNSTLLIFQTVITH